MLEVQVKLFSKFESKQVTNTLLGKPLNDRNEILYDNAEMMKKSRQMTFEMTLYMKISKEHQKYP